MKPGFLIYNDYRETLSTLTDEELGRLIRAMFDYEIDGVSPTLDKASMMAFNFIKQDLDRGKSQYEKICLRNKVNGSRGGRPRKTQINPDCACDEKTKITQIPKKPSGLLFNDVSNGNNEIPEKPNNPEKLTKLNLTKLNSNIYVTKWNQTFKTNYTSTRQLISPLAEWLKTYTIEQICKAVENIQFDPYWKGKDLDPIWLLRSRDKQGEVDRIGKMLNVKRVEEYTKL